MCLCKEKRSVFDKPRLQRLPKRLSLLFDYFAKSRVCLAFPKANTRSLHKIPAYSPRIRLRRILEFCAFAKKNAVSLANQGCKGCQNEALCTTESSVHGRKLCAQEKALCTGKSSVHRKKLCAQEKALCLCTALEKALCTGKSSVHSRKLCAQQKALCTAESSVLRKRLCACARHRKKLCARQKALCTGKSSAHRKKALCTVKSSVYGRKLCARQKAILSFVPLQRKTQCLRQNLVAKVLWHIKSPNLPKAPKKNAGFIGENRRTVPEFGLRRILELCAFAEKNAVSLTNQGCKGGKSGNRHNYLKFCAFAKKNAVSLANQGCKGCQNEALRHKSTAKGVQGDSPGRRKEGVRV